MKPLKEKVSITLDIDLLKKLREYAEIDDRTLSSYINLTLKRYIAYSEKMASQSEETRISDP